MVETKIKIRLFWNRLTLVTILKLENWKEMILKEFCAENFSNIPKAIKAGARRIELCDNLAVGGTTVSYGVLKETATYCTRVDIPVMVMIRPRGGDFVYNETEVSMMIADIDAARGFQHTGVVFGALTRDNGLDEATMKTLISAAHGLQITFHMAFDAIPAHAQFEAIDWLTQQGVHRILTHGGPASSSIEENFGHLKALIEHANKRIIILPGGKITAQNCGVVATTLGVNEVHGTKIVDFV